MKFIIRIYKPSMSADTEGFYLFDNSIGGAIYILIISTKITLREESQKFVKEIVSYADTYFA